MITEQAERFILIVGAPRSGTTLVSNMLSNHPDIYIFPQTQFFNKIWGARYLYNFKKNRHKMLEVISRDKAVKRSGIDLFFNKSALRNSFDDYFQEYIDLVNDYNMHRKRYIGDKTPRHIMVIKGLKNKLPVPLKVVAVVRDSRAVLASMKGRNLIKNMASGAAIWNTYARGINSLPRWFQPSDFLVLRYEDIIGDPEAGAMRIADTLGIPYSKKMVEVQDNNSSFLRHDKGGIYNDSLETWRTRLSPDEINCISTLTQINLDHFGYEYDKDVTKKISSGELAAYFFSLAQERLIVLSIKAGVFPAAILADFVKPYLGRP